MTTLTVNPTTLIPAKQALGQMGTTAGSVKATWADAPAHGWIGRCDTTGKYVDGLGEWKETRGAGGNTTIGITGGAGAAHLAFYNWSDDAGSDPLARATVTIGELNVDAPGMVTNLKVESDVRGEIVITFDAPTDEGASGIAGFVAIVPQIKGGTAGSSRAVPVQSGQRISDLNSGGGKVGVYAVANAPGVQGPLATAYVNVK